MIRNRFLSLLWVALASVVALWGCDTTQHVTAVTGTSDTAPPPSPENLAVVSQPEYHRLTWAASPAPDVVLYEVYQYLPDPSRDNSYVMIGEAAGNWFNLTPNQETIETHFRVRAVDTIGNRSPLSNEYAATLGPISQGGIGQGGREPEGDPRLRLAD